MLSKLKTELNPKQKRFLSCFPNTLFCYIPDYSKDAPVIHGQDLVLSRQQEGYGIFFTVNGFTGGKRTSENLTNLNAFFCDIDYPNKTDRTPAKLRQYKQEILMEMVSDELPIPTYIVETKNGFHVYWMFEEPLYLSNMNPEQQNQVRIQYRDVEEAILKRFDGDPGAKDVARVLRVPGTYHQKDPKDPFLCKIVHEATGGECVYTFEYIREKFLVPPPAETWAIAASNNLIDKDVKDAIEKEYPKLERDSYKKLFSKEAGTVPEGMRNKALLVASYAAKDAGWSFEDTCTHFNEFHGLSLREIRKTIRSAFEHNYDFGYNNEVMEAVVTQEERVQLSEITSKVLSKSTKLDRAATNNQQKEKYNTYEYIIADRFPYLKYKWRGDFYNYKEGVYRPRQVEEVRSMVFREMLKDGLVNYRTVSRANDKIATFKSLDGKTFFEGEENPNDQILNFQNGLLDMSTYQLMPHTPEYLSTSQIPVMYNHAATCPNWMKFISEVSSEDEDQMKLLQQIAGYVMTTDTRYAKAFILYGSGANGKSLFNRMISKIVGRDAISSLNLSTITKQFGLTGLIGKKVNFIDEISGNYFESNVIKGLISGERMAAEVKYRPEPLEFVPTAKLIFSVNELPKINDTTPGLYRRFIIVPFDRSFEDNPDLELENKLTQELTGILNWAIEGVKSLRADGHFNETKKNFEMMRNFKSDNSPVVEFISLYYQSVIGSEETKYAIGISDLYAQYRSYCMDHGYKSKALANFSREVTHNKIDGFPLRISVEGGRKMVYGIRKKLTLGGEPIIYPDSQ